MRVYYWTGVIVTASFLLNACTVGETPPTASDSPSPAATPVAAVPPKAQTPNTIFKPAIKVSPNDPKQPLFKTSFVPSNSGGAALINTTDKGKLLDQLSKKFNLPINPKRDPFLAIDGTIPIPVVPSQVKPQLPPPARRVVVNKPGKPGIKVLPDPTEAKSISVTGIMDMAGTSYAIVNVPGEPTSRYIKVGQRLANNQVLVKRIETVGTPTVVFQQFNVEVPRAVGQQVVAAAPEATTNSGLAPNPAAPATTPAGVILPPNPNQTPAEILKPGNSPVIISPAGVPIPNPAVAPPQ
jgi:hypothetical protein